MDSFKVVKNKMISLAKQKIIKIKFVNALRADDHRRKWNFGDAISG